METIAYTFCAYLPIHLLAYLPFLDLLRFGKFWMAATVAGNMVLHLLGVAWMISLGRPDLVMAVGLAMVPLSLALYFLNIRLAPGKLLFTYMLLVNYQSMAQGISAFCAVRLFHADARSLESGLLCLALFALAWLPMHRLFRYAARQVYRIDAPPAVAGHLAAARHHERHRDRIHRGPWEWHGRVMAVPADADQPAAVRGSGLLGAAQRPGWDPETGRPPGAAEPGGPSAGGSDL